MMRSDKSRARTRQRKISERDLFLAAVYFGAIGGTLIMQVLRHKTNHRNFSAFFPTIIIIQIAILGILAIKMFALKIILSLDQCKSLWVSVWGPKLYETKRTCTVCHLSLKYKAWGSKPLGLESFQALSICRNSCPFWYTPYKVLH